MLRLDLKVPLLTDEVVEINNLVVYYNSFGIFMPLTVDLYDDQKVAFKLMLLPASFYRIEKAIYTNVLGDNWFTKVHTHPKPVEPLSPTSDIRLIVLNAHFTQAQSVTRYVEVSHWGNVYTREYNKLTNRAATFKGEFSTIDFNPGRKDTGRHCYRSATVKLPVDAWGLYFRDEVGNITSAYPERKDDAIEIALFPRFALLGGWNLTWDISYNAPSSNYLTKHVSESDYVLKLDLGYLLTDIPSDKYHLRVALPEGAEILDVTIPGQKPSINGQVKTFSYLDFVGRPTVNLTFYNFLPRVNPNQTLIIRYRFKGFLLIVEPLYLSIGLFLCFSIYLVVSRLDLSFGHEETTRKKKRRPAVPSATGQETEGKQKEE